MLGAASEDRALASGIIIFVAIIVVAGLVFIMLDTAASDIFTVAGDYTDNSAAQDHVDLLETIWGGILVFVVFVAGLFLIGRAVLESRRPG